MKFPSSLLFVSGLAAGQSTFSRCGSEQVSGEAAAALVKAARPVPLETARLAGPTPIDTYVHLVFNGGANDVPQSRVDAQMRVLNEAYGPFGFTFNLVNVTRTTGELDRASLRQGGYDTLNLYFPTVLADDLLGYCSFPTYLGGDWNTEDIAYDGCVNHAESMPGGSYTNFDLGLTAVHEIGHWLGLYHVFSRSCSGSGDYVDDTPPQVNATSGCPTVVPDSCPLNPGLDSIHNYMDYSWDVCMTEFTPGQIERGTNIFNSLRVGVQQFSEPTSLPGGAIQAPRRNCAGEPTYLGVRRFADGAFDVARCQLHCRETNQWNARHGRPQRCRFINTYLETQGGTSVQQCALYTQSWGSQYATNKGQTRPKTGSVVISSSFSSSDILDNGVPSSC